MGYTDSAATNEASWSPSERWRVSHSLLSQLPTSPVTLSHSYWTMHFDTSPHTLRSLNGIMRRDPRVLRWTVLKLADKVEDISKQGQKFRVDNKPLAVDEIVD